MTRFVQFCCVGLSGMVVDFGSFHLLRGLGLLGELSLGVVVVPYANMLSVALAIQWNFLLNWRWTFRDRDSALGAAWWRFNLFSSSTWVLNNVIVGLCWFLWPGTLTLAGQAVSRLNLYKLLAIGICTLANYWLSARLAFQARPGSEPIP